MKTTIIIVGDNNFWYSCGDVEYYSENELEHLINEQLDEVRDNINNEDYEYDTQVESLTVILGEIKYSNLSI